MPENDANQIKIGDPSVYCWDDIANQAAEWIQNNPEATDAILVYYPPVNGLDLKTRAKLLEFRGDLVARGNPPIAGLPVLKRFYSTVMIGERKIVDG